eukprot:2236233-Pleurochrysis_carterae.AAC.1
MPFILLLVPARASQRQVRSNQEHGVPVSYTAFRIVRPGSKAASSKSALKACSQLGCSPADRVEARPVGNVVERACAWVPVRLQHLRQH